MLQGLKGGYGIGTLCHDHTITQGIYYKWHDQLLSDGVVLLQQPSNGAAEAILEVEHRFSFH